jgi:hypothetical protein
MLRNKKSIEKRKRLSEISHVVLFVDYDYDYDYDYEHEHERSSPGHRRVRKNRMGRE